MQRVFDLASWDTDIESIRLAKVHGRAEFGEEIVAFVIHDDKLCEALEFDSSHIFHAEFFVLENFDLADRVFGQACCRAADRPEVEATVSLARIDNLL